MALRQSLNALNEMQARGQVLSGLVKDASDFLKWIHTASDRAEPPRLVSHFFSLDLHWRTASVRLAFDYRRYTNDIRNPERAVTVNVNGSSTIWIGEWQTALTHSSMDLLDRTEGQLTAP